MRLGKRAFEQHGKISPAELRHLDWPELEVG